MCIDFDGHHFGDSSFVYVNDFCYYKKILYRNWAHNPQVQVQLREKTDQRES